VQVVCEEKAVNTRSQGVAAAGAAGAGASNSADEDASAENSLMARRRRRRERAQTAYIVHGQAPVIDGIVQPPANVIGIGPHYHLQQQQQQQQPAEVNIEICKWVNIHKQIHRRSFLREGLGRGLSVPPNH